MIDQSAAYDLLSHEIFAEKLRLYNFDEAAVTWVMSYLVEGPNVYRLRICDKEIKFRSGMNNLPSF